MTERPIAACALAAAAGLVLAGLSPFDVSIDLGDLRAAVKRARPVPFGPSLGGAPAPAEPWSWAQEGLSTVLTGALFALAMKEAGKGGLRAVAATAALGGALALAIESAQVAIPGRVADMTSVVIALIGSATGAAVVSRSPQRTPRQWVGPALVVWALAVMLAAWTPPHLAARGSRSLQAWQLMPFWSYYRRTDVYAVADLLNQVMSFIPLGVLLAVKTARLPAWRALVVGLGLGLVLEVGQLGLAERTAEITDALSAGVGAFLGARLWHWAVAIRTSSAGHVRESAETAGAPLSRFYEIEPRARARAVVAGRSHPGKVRPNNEDNYLAVRRYRGRDVLATSLLAESLDEPEDEAYALAVADGMGGHNFGELASLLAVRTGWELGGSEIKWPMKVNDREADDLQQKAAALFQLIDDAIRRDARVAPPGRHGHDADDLLLDRPRAVRPARRRLAGLPPPRRHPAAADPRPQHGPGAGRYRHSRARLARGRAIAERPDQRPGRPRRGFAVEVNRHRLADGDRVLLCTDGLTDLVADDEIARVLEQTPAPADVCRALIDLALERGGKDNITVLVARYEIGDDPAPEHRP